MNGARGRRRAAPVGPTWVQKATVTFMAVVIFTAPGLTQAAANGLFGR